MVIAMQKKQVGKHAIRMSIREFHERYADDFTLFCKEMYIPAYGTQVTRFSDVAEEWQIRDTEIMASAISKLWHGKLHDKTNYRNVWLTRPRGHDKTSSIARLMLWVLSFDCRYRKIVPLTCYAAAVDKDQALILYDCMKSLARINKYPVKFRRSGLVIGPGGTLHIMSSDAASSYGLTGHVFIFDEITQWNTPSAKDFFDSLWSGRGKVRDSCTFVLTNSGYKNTWQYELLCQLKKDPSWYVYDEPGRLAKWSVVTDDMVAGLSKERVDMLFYNHWIDESSVNIYDLFMSCCDENKRIVPGDSNAFCTVIAVDYATSRDLCVVTTAHVGSWIYYDDMVCGRFSPSEIEDLIYRTWQRYSCVHPTFVVADRYQMEYMSEVLRSKGCNVELLKPTRKSNQSMMASFVDMLRHGMLYFSSPYIGECFGSSLESDLRKCVFDFERGRIVFNGDGYDDRIICCMYVLLFLIKRGYINSMSGALNYDVLKKDFGTAVRLTDYLNMSDLSRIVEMYKHAGRHSVFGIAGTANSSDVFGLSLRRER